MQLDIQHAMTEVLRDHDSESDDIEDLEVLRDLEELKELVDQEEKKSGKQSTWKGSA